jgi:signal peptidase I
MNPTQSEQENVISQVNTGPNNEPANKKQSFLQGLGDFSRFAGIVIAFVIVIRFFIAQPFIVSGASMVPNFASSDYLIIDELTYRFHPPQRGDVVIFHPPVDPGTYYIKRIIGIPGDNVSVRNGVVTITNKTYPTGMVLSENYITKDTLIENKSVDVTEGKYFVMGDNRPESYDSRGWGLLPAKNITGRALLRLFPIGNFGVLPGESKLVGIDGSVL